MELIGDVKTSAWGAVGNKSEVAKLFQANCSSFVINNDCPYAELWMGDHPSGPSKIKSTGEVLSSFLKNSDSKVIGSHPKLPFLFKVLSIRAALSIQVHPNKVEAERLHAENPDQYPDDNHKPELAIALTPFDAICGFRPYKEIIKNCKKFPPLLNLIGNNFVDTIKIGSEGLKLCFETLMTASEEDVAECIQDIGENYFGELSDLGLFETFLILNHEYPNDVGVLCIFFLNVIHLLPGEAIYLPANEPHAYLKGDCIECMACSDNVVRAGLTPKFKDVPTLIEMLSYEGQEPEKKLFLPIRKNQCLELFIPDIDDFAVAKICIPLNLGYFQMKNEKFGAILIVLQGERNLKIKDKMIPLKRGSIIFIPGDAGERIEFEQVKFDSTESFIGYMAMYNSFK